MVITLDVFPHCRLQNQKACSSAGEKTKYQVRQWVDEEVLGVNEGAPVMRTHEQGTTLSIMTLCFSFTEMSIK